MKSEKMMPIKGCHQHQPSSPHQNLTNVLSVLPFKHWCVHPCFFFSLFLMVHFKNLGYIDNKWATRGFLVQNLQVSQVPGFVVERAPFQSSAILLALFLRLSWLSCQVQISVFHTPVPPNTRHRLVRIYQSIDHRVHKCTIRPHTVLKLFHINNLTSS